MKKIINFWQKGWRSKLILIIGGFFLFLVVVGLFSSKGRKNFQEGYEAGKKGDQLPIPTLTPETSLSPSPFLEISPIPSPTPISFQNPTLTPTPTRKIVMGSNTKGIDFYKKIETLHKQGKVVGELYTEFESDQIVDVNPDTQSVQLSLKYSSITDSVDEADKQIILSDFKIIKSLAEQDKSLIVSGFGTLRLFVLTFHDITGNARGELEQLMTEEEPQWFDLK